MLQARLLEEVDVPTVAIPAHLDQVDDLAHPDGQESQAALDFTEHPEKLHKPHASSPHRHLASLAHKAHLDLPGLLDLLETPATTDFPALRLDPGPKAHLDPRVRLGLKETTVTPDRLELLALQLKGRLHLPERPDLLDRLVLPVCFTSIY